MESVWKQGQQNMKYMWSHGKINFAERQSDLDTDYVADFGDNEGQGLPAHFRRHKFPKTLTPTRFLGCDIFYTYVMLIVYRVLI